MLLLFFFNSIELGFILLLCLKESLIFLLSIGIDWDWYMLWLLQDELLKRIGSFFCSSWIFCKNSNWFTFGFRILLWWCFIVLSNVKVVSGSSFDFIKLLILLFILYVFDGFIMTVCELDIESCFDFLFNLFLNSCFSLSLLSLSLVSLIVSCFCLFSSLLLFSNSWRSSSIVHEVSIPLCSRYPFFLKFILSFKLICRFSVSYWLFRISYTIAFSTNLFILSSFLFSVSIIKLSDIFLEPVTLVTLVTLLLFFFNFLFSLFFSMISIWFCFSRGFFKFGLWNPPTTVCDNIFSFSFKFIFLDFGNIFFVFSAIFALFVKYFLLGIEWLWLCWE